MSIYRANGVNPVAVWSPTNDTAGRGTATLNDLEGGVDLTLTNMTPASDWVDEGGGLWALDFDGVNDHLTAAASPISGPPFTVNVWFRMTVDSGAKRLVSFSDIQWNFIFSFWTFGRNIGFNEYSVSNNQFVTSTGSPIVLNRWHMATYVCTGPSYREIWLDGNLLFSSTVTATHGTVDMTAVGQIINVQFFPGRMDDIRTYAANIGSAGISELWAGGTGRGTTAAAIRRRRRFTGVPM